MILILGQTHDDILYFDTKVRNRKEETILDNRKVILGDILGQQVVLSYGNYSNYVSSAITTYIIQKYDAIMVICVGTCRAFSSGYRTGSIAISNVTYLGDVNLNLLAKVKTGQIPDMPSFFVNDVYLFSLCNKLAEKLAITDVIPSTFISSNIAYVNDNQTNSIKRDEVIFGKNVSLVTDTESGGCCISAFLNKVPFIAIKVVTSGIKDSISTDEMVVSLKTFALVGKLITATIGEIGRNDTQTIKPEN